jgi:hypothetical protein
LELTQFVLDRTSQLQRERCGGTWLEEEHRRRRTGPIRRWDPVQEEDGVLGVDRATVILTPQAGKLAWIAKVNTKLYRAYLMKEQLRLAIRKKGVLALAMLDGWLDWAQRCRIPAFVELGRKIRKKIAGIEVAMLNNLSNALIESTNTKIRVLHRMAFGFAKPEHLIALALLDRGGYCPPLPGRSLLTLAALA